MALLHVIAGHQASAQATPRVRRISASDVFDALGRGVDDFSAMPSHAVFLCAIYPIVGLVLFRLVIGYDVLPMLFPLAAGFALLGPIAALGLYEMSRRREEGLTTTWRQSLQFVHSPSFGSIAALAAVLLVIFLVWLATANAIHVAYFGYIPIASIPDFLGRLFTTPEGWSLIVVGNIVGFLFALLVLVISVVSFPLLLERDVGAVVAVLTSARAVVTNPIPMILWGLIVAVALLVGSIPFFVGLAVVVPVLGHATWHLYRKVVV